MRSARGNIARGTTRARGENQLMVRCPMMYITGPNTPGTLSRAIWPALRSPHGDVPRGMGWIARDAELAHLWAQTSRLREARAHMPSEDPRGGIPLVQGSASTAFMRTRRFASGPYLRFELESLFYF